jgi:hypothetical protein
MTSILTPLMRGRLERLYLQLTGVDTSALTDAELIRRVKIARELDAVYLKAGWGAAKIAREF